ncbi:acyl-CoA thioesterase [Rhodococcus koreensis]
MHDSPTSESPSHVALAEILKVSALGDDLFVGAPAPDGTARLYGGHAIAQAISAASATVAEKQLRSIRVHFVRSGGEDTSLLLRVTREHTGRRMATRLVTGEQDGRCLFVATALFAAPVLPGVITVAHEDSPYQMPAIPRETAHERQVRAGAVLHASTLPRYLRTGLRFIDDPPRVAALTGQHPTRSRTYYDLRSVDDQHLAAALGYASDLSMLDPIAHLGGLVWQESAVPTTLNHSVTIHRPGALRDWVLFDRQCASTAGGVGFVTGSVFDSRGFLVASVDQQALLLEPA